MDETLKKLRWRCRRGTLELDVVLQRFLANAFHQISKREQLAFLQLLELEDDQLTAYIIDNKTSDDPLQQAVILKIREG